MSKSPPPPRRIRPKSEPEPESLSDILDEYEGIMRGLGQVLGEALSGFGTATAAMIYAAAQSPEMAEVRASLADRLEKLAEAVR